MGLCFSYQQTRDFELRLSSLFALLVPRDDGTYDGDDGNQGGDCDKSVVEQVDGVIAPSIAPSPSSSPPLVCDDTKPPALPPTATLEPRERKKKHKPPKYESKSVQVDLSSETTFPSAPTPTIPTPQLSSPPPGTTPTSNNVNDALAQEERRRRREERRAARNAHNEVKLKLELNIRSPSEYLDERCKLDVHFFKGFDGDKKCLVLDIDYTIFDHKSDFELAPEYKRPYLHEFLKTCSKHYNIVIWSATAFYHVHTKMEKLQLLNHPDFQISCALCKDHMIPHTFSVKRKIFVQDIKPLALLWRKFPDYFDHCNTIHIDDVAENFALNPRNGLRIDPFREALVNRQTDKELFYLTLYLSIIAPLSSLSSLDHSKWKDYVINALWGAQTAFELPSFTQPEPASILLLQQHEQAMILKQALKEKMKEQEREERAKEREREEQARREGQDVGNKINGRGFGSIVTEAMTSVAMEVVAEVVTEELTKGAMEAALESMDPTWTSDNFTKSGTEQAERVETMDQQDCELEMVESITEEGMGGVDDQLDVQILLTTALTNHPSTESNYEEQPSEELGGRGTREWENKIDWSREDLEVQHMKEMNAQAVF